MCESTLKRKLAKALLTAVALFLLSNAAVADRPAILSRSELPLRRFPFMAPPSVLMDLPEFGDMLPSIRGEAERLLSDYDIQDATITQELLFGLAAVAVLERRPVDAIRRIAEYRAAQTKPQGRAIGGLIVELAAATLVEPTSQGCDAAAKRLSDRLREADPAVIRDSLLALSSAIQTASNSFYAGAAIGILDPVVSERGSLDVLQALKLAFFRTAADRIPACRPELTATARAWIDAPATQLIDMWPSRQPPAADFSDAHPVVVAVWDRGYDVTLFPGQLAHDPVRPRDGRDSALAVADDGNGPTYDSALLPRSGAMALPTGWLQARLASQMAYDKGELDLRYGLDTSEARLFAEFARRASTIEQGDEFLAYLENAGRVHGTACASEIADGAPYVRLFNIAALPWGRDENKQEIAYDEATIGRWAAAIDRLGPRLKRARVRVVNMSWGLTADEVTQQLLDHNLEADPLRAKARGTVMQAEIGNALQRLMIASPDVLFVVAAGNSNQFDDAQSDAVQRLHLPNLIIVGATGVSGRPTGFTVFGASIAIYAQGEAVPARWPGNITVRMSGTSMAAPLVSRAAAQMLAVNPRLTAADVRDGLIKTASTGDIRLLHPAAAVTWAGLQPKFAKNR